MSSSAARPTRRGGVRDGSTGSAAPPGALRARERGGSVPETKPAVRQDSARAADRREALPGIPAVPRGDTPIVPDPIRTGRRTPALRDGALASPVAVAVLAGDPVTGQGAAAFLSSCPGVKVLTADRQHEAEVVLVLVTQVTEETLEWMEQAAARARRELRFVLVGDGVREQHLLRAVTCGLVSVIPRQDADFDRILRAIDAVREDRLEVPDVAVGWLVNQMRAIQQDVLAPLGVTPAGLEARETEVLRLLAEGLGTPEIAAALNYSDRTVKNIIHGVLTRCGLRNRAHAVAFALRSGAI
jgi:DNA-binding NarL/FixJ family response regulator